MSRNFFYVFPWFLKCTHWIDNKLKVILINSKFKIKSYLNLWTKLTIANGKGSINSAVAFYKIKLSWQSYLLLSLWSCVLINSGLFANHRVFSLFCIDNSFISKQPASFFAVESWTAWEEWIVKSKFIQNFLYTVKSRAVECLH